MAGAPKESESIARMMRGKVPEYDDSYVDAYIPAHILRRLRLGDWTDDDKFEWGFRHVGATKVRSTSEIVITVAGNYLGHGCHLVKIVRPHSSTPDAVEIVHADDLA